MPYCVSTGRFNRQRRCSPLLGFSAIRKSSGLAITRLVLGGRHGATISGSDEWENAWLHGRAPISTNLRRVIDSKCGNSPTALLGTCVTKQPERWVTATAGIYLARGKQVEVRVTPTSAAITEWVELAHEFSNRVLRSGGREFPRGWDVRERPQVRTLCRRVVVQVLPEPSLDFCHAHPLAFAIVGNLVAVDLTETEIARFRMGEVEPTHARAGPHRKGLRDQHSGVGLHIEQSPKGALFRVIRARRVTRSRPDPPVLLCDEIRVAQALCTTVAPFIPHPLVQALGESFCQAIGDGLRHDRVVVV